MTNEEHMQEILLEFRILAEQLQQLQEQVRAVEERLHHVEALQGSMDELRKAEKGSETLMPLSEGIFVRGSLLDNQKLLVNVGANTVVEKTVAETKAMLEERGEEMKKFHEQLVAMMQELRQRGRELEKELEKSQ